MKIISLDAGKTTRLFYIVAGLIAVVMFLTAKQDDTMVVVGAIFLTIVSIYPFYLWLLGWSFGLPLWPVFVAANGIIAALPMIQESRNLADYTSSDILAGAMTLVVFIILGTGVWLGLTAWRKRPPQSVYMISAKHAERYLFAFVLLGILFYFNTLAGFYYGNLLQVARGVAITLNTLGIFVLAFYDGRRLLSRWQGIWLIILTALTALLAAAGLIMATALIPVMMLLMGYALGSGRVPWRSLVVVLLVAAVLHPGKFAMRQLYWGENSKPVTPEMLPGFYIDWFGSGLDQVGSIIGLSSKIPEEETATTLFERSGNLHMLLLVQKKTPNSIPFLGGRSYEFIPKLLIPRVLNEDKGRSNEGNVLLSTRYGLQTLEQTETTSIAWGLVPEAYANFGYVGVVGLAIVLAVFYSFITNLTRDVPMTSLRFVLGLLVMGAALKADTMGVFVTSQFQGMMGVSLAALVLMKSQPNPFAMQGKDSSTPSRFKRRGWRSYLFEEEAPRRGRSRRGRPKRMAHGRNPGVENAGKNHSDVVDLNTKAHEPWNPDSPQSGDVRRNPRWRQ